MSKIIKSVSMKDSPVVLSSPQFVVAVPEIDRSVLEDLTQSMHEEANRVLSEAKETAEKCVQEAIKQSENIKQNAYEEGRTQGYQEGIDQGRQDALAQMKQQVEQTIGKAIEKAELVQGLADDEYTNRILKAEHEIINIALAVARKILAQEIEENPAVVLPIVHEALEKVRDQEQITIRVSTDDFDQVLQAKIDLQVMVGSEHSLKIVSDRTLQHGSCVIDTSYGTVDARVDVQFETLKKALQGVLP